MLIGVSIDLLLFPSIYLSIYLYVYVVITQQKQLILARYL